jgi:serine protease AprX
VAVVAAVAVATPVAAAPRAPHAPTTLGSVAASIGTAAFRNGGADGRGVDVALVDTGVARVPVLAGAVVDGADLTSDATGRDGFGHGTHLAGIITGGAGLAPGARVVSVKVADRNGATDLRTVVAGIDWVVRNRTTGGRNIRVLNLSLGTDGLPAGAADPLAAAVERAWQAGIVVVVAAGNDGAGAAGLDRPATDPFVVAVGASDSRGTAGRADDVVASFSSRGDAHRAPDVVAPGTSVVSARAPGSAADHAAPAARLGVDGFRGSGTSQAAAVVSAAAALVLSRTPGLTPDQVKAVLTASATPLPGAGHRVQGAGLVDLRRAATTPVPAPAVRHPSPAPSLTSRDELSVAADWSGNRWRGNRWRGNRWRGNRWSSASWGA